MFVPQEDLVQIVKEFVTVPGTRTVTPCRVFAYVSQDLREPCVIFRVLRVSLVGTVQSSVIVRSTEAVTQ